MTKTLPEFKSEEEEAQFWDTHNSLDYIKSDEPVEIEVDPKVTAKIRKQAQTKNAGREGRVNSSELREYTVQEIRDFLAADQLDIQTKKEVKKGKKRSREKKIESRR